jgi:hypothetical protein
MMLDKIEKGDQQGDPRHPVREIAKILRGELQHVLWQFADAADGRERQIHNAITLAMIAKTMTDAQKDEHDRQQEMMAQAVVRAGGGYFPHTKMPRDPEASIGKVILDEH